MTTTAANISSPMRLRAIRNAMFAGRNVVTAIRGASMCANRRYGRRNVVALGSGVT